MSRRGAKSFSGKLRGAEAQAAQAARIRNLLASADARRLASRVHRPTGLAAVETRYASIGAVGDWRRPGAALAVAECVLDAVADGTDRAVLSWPQRACDGVVAVAVALREARARGLLAHSAIAVWPWRAPSGASHGSMGPTRSLYVHPDDLRAVGRGIATAVAGRQEWCRDGFAHFESARVEIRAGDLCPPAGVAFDGERVPTLRELTPAFSLDAAGNFGAEPGQLLRRVLRFTAAGAGRRGGRDQIAHALGIAECPKRAPHAIYGLPLEGERILSAALRFERFCRDGLDAVVVNLHGEVLKSTGNGWQDGLEALVAALSSARGRRPPVVLYSDDPHAVRRAEAILRVENGRLRRVAPVRRGIFAPAHLPVSDLPPAPGGGIARYRADIKDAGLAPMRREAIAIGRIFEASGDRTAMRAARGALDALHIAASMPFGLAEAGTAADTIWNGDSDEERAALSLFYPRQSIRRLAASASAAGLAINESADLVRRAEERLDTWNEATPVSIKLASLLADPAWNAPSTVISFRDARITALFDLASPAGLVRARTTTHRDLAAALGPGRAIVVGPNHAAISALLATSATPGEVLLLGDCAGIGLSAALLRALSGYPGLGVVGERARELGDRIAAGGGDASLDRQELAFRIAPVPEEGVLDFSRGGDAFRGDIAVIRTTRREIRFRANAKVPVYTPEEVRPFELRVARTLVKGEPIPVFGAEISDRLRRAMARSSRTRAVISGYHSFIAAARGRLPHHDLSACARLVAERMGAPGEVNNIRVWLSAGLRPRGEGERVRPEAPRDWPRFVSFMRALGTDEAAALNFWRFMVLPTRSFSVQEGALFHEVLARFLVDPEGSAHLTRGESVESLLDAVREAVDTVTGIEIIKGPPA